MPIEITMPRLSDTMEEGTLIKWRVSVGDKVANGDLLADIETDKATMELQSYDDGTVAVLAVQEGQTTPVGQMILLLAEEGETVQDVVGAVGVAANNAAQAQSQNSPPATNTVVPSVVATEQGSVRGSNIAGSERVRVSPVARKMAQEFGVDLSTVKGTGPDGRIIKRDILAVTRGPSVPAVAKTPVTHNASAAELPMGQAAVDMPPSQTIALSNMRKTIARRLVESKTTIPHFTVTVVVAVDRLMDLRAQINAQVEERGIKLSVNDFLVKASALALAGCPQVNSSWAEGKIQQHGVINVGVAISLPQEKGGGLVVATIRNTHQKTLRQISTETRQLAQKARQQGLSIEDMADGTFTISNLGMFDVEHFEAIINPPQAAILAVGAAIQKPVVRQGQMAVGYEMTVTLSADHRVIDGSVAAQFLQTLRQMLENPAILLV